MTDELVAGRRNCINTGRRNLDLVCFGYSLDRLTESPLCSVIPSEDGHLSEYVAPSDKRIQWISGFTGSASTAIISKRSAYLFVDPRCWIQAIRELDSGWQILKTGTPEVKDWIEWVIARPRGSKIGIDSRMISYERATRLYKGLCERGSKLAHPRQNLVDLVWDRRPKRPKNYIYMQPVEFTGRDVKEKLRDVQKWIRKQNAAIAKPSESHSDSFGSGNEEESPLRQTTTANATAATTPTPNTGDRITALFVSNLTSIAYILNLRGNDIPYNPVFTAYLLIGEDGRTILFIEGDKVPKEVEEYLHRNDITIQEYSDVWAFLRAKQWGEGKVIINPSTPYVVSLIIGSARYTVLPPFIEEMRAIKNQVELDGMKNAHVRDGTAMVRWFAWLEQELFQDHSVSEWEASEKLDEFRRLCGGEGGVNMYIGPAYDSVVAIGSNAALPHYRPTKYECALIGKNEPFFIASGGQYRDGMCNVTRTVHFGHPTVEQSEAFTKVLQRHVSFVYFSQNGQMLIF